MCVLMKKPFGFREVNFNDANSRMFSVFAFAKPDDYGQTPASVFSYLQSLNVRVVVGLEANTILSDTATAFGIEYRDRTIPDMSAPPVELYDEFYDLVMDQNQQGYKVGIHCWGGIGRTGALLTAFGLRLLSTDTRFRQSFLERNYFVEDAAWRSVPCSLNVATLIQSLRTQSGNEGLVESREQIESLCAYEVLLRKRCLFEAQSMSAIAQKF